MEYIIDRFEENFAVCEDRKTKKIINIEKSKLPKSAKEGDVIIKEKDKYNIDSKKTEEIKSKMKEKFADLWQ